jgi:crotonobetaine/carnitine-CoA ligase
MARDDVPEGFMMSEAATVGALPASPLSPGQGAVTVLFEQIPKAERTIAAVWAQALATDPDRSFIAFEGRESLTYRELDARMARWQRIFAESGLERGDRFATLLFNGPEHVAAFLAAAVTGVVIVPINTNAIGASLLHALRDSQARLLITSAEWAARLDREWSLPQLETLVIVGDGEAPPVAATVRHCDDVPVGGGSEIYPARPEDLLAVLYTSGTTGPPKGAMVSHEYYTFVSWKFAYHFGHTRDDVLLTVLPMFHVNAQCVALLAAVMSGARVAMYPRFSATSFWRWVQDSGATYFAAMGAMGNILLRRPADEFQPGHRLRACQIVPAPEPLEAFEQRFGVRVMSEVYGMTEASILLPSHRAEGAAPGRMGKNDRYFEVRVVDDADEELPRGSAGELVIRPRIPGIIFSGYLGNPEATVAATRNLWFHTGDLGVQDADGEYWYRGRLKDVIRRRGENISAFEIEHELLRRPGVVEAAAVGVPSELGEDDVMAFVVVDDPAVDEPACHRWCEQHLPAHMVPRYVERIDALPKNSSERVLKRELKERGVGSATWEATGP